MTKETKKQVFDETMRVLTSLHKVDMDRVSNLIHRYAAALPDNLPVIPEAVGAFIKRQKAAEDNLATLFHDACGFDKERDNGWSMFRDTDKFLWAYDNQNTFARAWVLGVWRVEETGEIVKFEGVE